MSYNILHMNFIRLVFFSIIINISLALFGSQLKQLKDKASSIYKSHRKSTNLNFMGLVASDYPGTNFKYIKINEENWEEYYSCLKLQEDNLGQYLAMSPQAVLGFEGASVKLECRICISPLEKDNKELIQWEWAPIDGKHLEPVDYNENIVISPEDKTLHLYNLETAHSGQYICILGEASTAPYFLTILSFTDDEFIEVHSPETSQGPYAKDPEVVNEFDLVVDTEWSDWSACSTCGKIGRKHKLGYCSVFAKENKELTVAVKPVEDELEFSTEFANLIESSSTKAAAVENETISEDLELLTVFQFGIPCKSHILPENFQEISQIQNRSNEIMMGYCRVKCKTNQFFVVKDSHGKVIEKANNSAGIYSLMQSLPPLEPSVARQIIYGVKGKTIILSCPGSMNTDAPIMWQIGNKNLIPEVIAAESSRRIFISITDRIHITDAKISDSSIYSCWQAEELAGTIRLVIEKKMEFNFNHTVMLIGIIIIMVVFLRIFIKAFIGRKYAKV